MTNKVSVKEINVCLPEDLLNAVSAYCSQKGCTRDSFIMEAIEQYLEDQEDYEEAVEAWKEGKKTGVYYTAEEVFKELGL